MSAEMLTENELKALRNTVWGKADEQRGLVKLLRAYESLSANQNLADDVELLNEKIDSLEAENKRINEERLQRGREILRLHERIKEPETDKSVIIEARDQAGIGWATAEFERDAALARVKALEAASRPCCVCGKHHDTTRCAYWPNLCKGCGRDHDNEGDKTRCALCDTGFIKSMVSRLHAAETALGTVQKLADVSAQKLTQAEKSLASARKLLQMHATWPVHPDVNAWLTSHPAIQSVSNETPRAGEAPAKQEEKEPSAPVAAPKEECFGNCKADCDYCAPVAVKPKTRKWHFELDDQNPPHAHKVLDDDPAPAPVALVAAPCAGCAELRRTLLSNLRQYGLLEQAIDAAVEALENVNRYDRADDAVEPALSVLKKAVGK